MPTSPPNADTPTAFVPISRRARRDGWSGDRQRRFIAALETGGGVTAAAAAVGMTRASAYRLRRDPRAALFARAWDAALAAAATPAAIPLPADIGEDRVANLTDGQLIAQLIRLDHARFATCSRDEC